MNEKLNIDAKTIYYFLKAHKVVKTKEWNYSIRPCVLMFNTWHSNIISQNPKRPVSCSNSGYGGFGAREKFEKEFYVGYVSEIVREGWGGCEDRYAFFKSEGEAELYVYKSGMMESKLKHEEDELVNIKSRGFAKIKEIAKVLHDIDRVKKMA